MGVAFDDNIGGVVLVVWVITIYALAYDSVHLGMQGLDSVALVTFATCISHFLCRSESQCASHRRCRCFA